MKPLALSFSILNAICSRLFGFQVHLHRRTGVEPLLDDALGRLQKHQIEIATLIDVGASDGIWSKAFAHYFPGRQHLLVDANEVHRPKLIDVCSRYSNWRFELTAVGPSNGTLYFDGSNPLVGHLAEIPLNENYRPCPVTTLDRLVEKEGLSGPFMIKLDTHGVELPILSGASETLKQTNALVIEAYNLTWGGSAVPFWDLCQHLLGLGFRPLDLFDVLYREVDSALWQMDLLFARSDLPLFQERRYSRQKVGST
jgi:FkbM family methyltransferase